MAEDKFQSVFLVKKVAVSSRVDGKGDEAEIEKVTQVTLEAVDLSASDAAELYGLQGCDVDLALMRVQAKFGVV